MHYFIVFQKIRKKYTNFCFLLNEAECEWCLGVVCLQCNFSVDVLKTATSYSRTRENMFLFIFVFIKYECLDVRWQSTQEARAT